MRLFHSTSLEFTHFLKNTDHLKSWAGDKFENLGVWCSDNPQFCLHFFYINYRKRYSQLLELNTKIDEDLILDARKTPNKILDMLIFTNNDIQVRFKDLIFDLYKLSLKAYGEIFYWDKKLQLPSYETAEYLINSAKLLGYKGIVFSERLPRGTDEKMFCDVVSTLIFDSKDLIITKKEVYEVNLVKA